MKRGLLDAASKALHLTCFEEVSGNPLVQVLEGLCMNGRAVFVAGILMTLLAGNAGGQVTQAELDAAKAKAELAELQKKEAEARKAQAEADKAAADARKAAAIADAEASTAAATAKNTLAKAQAETEKAQSDAAIAAATARTNLAKAQAEAEKAQVDASNAAATAKVALAKAQAEAEKAQIDAAKAGLPTIPDPAKYKIDKPTAVTLTATVSRLTFHQAHGLANRLADDIAATVTGLNAAQPVALVPDDVRLRTLLALEQSVNNAAVVARSRLVHSIGELNAMMAPVPVQPPPPTNLGLGAAAAPLSLIGNLAETALAYATILRTQYAFSSVVTSSNAEATLVAQAQSKLASRQNLEVVDPEAVLVLSTSASTITKNTRDLTDTIALARQKVLDAAAWSKEKRGQPPLPDTATDTQKKARAAELAAAAEVDRVAATLGGSSDDAGKMMAALYVVDAQGNTPIDAALRGEALRSGLSNKLVLTLTLKVISADADTVVSDGLFRGLRMHVGHTTVARWKLSDSGGVLRGAGVSAEANSPSRVELGD